LNINCDLLFPSLTSVVKSSKLVESDTGTGLRLNTLSTSCWKHYTQAIHRLSFHYTRPAYPQPWDEPTSFLLPLSNGHHQLPSPRPPQMQMRHHATTSSSSSSSSIRLLKTLVITNTPDTRSRNRRQKLAPETGVGFWRQFFTPVAKFLAPETNTDE